MLKVLFVIIEFVVLIIAVGFFTSSETAFLSIQKIQLRQMLKKKTKGAEQTAFLKSRTDQLLTLVLIGTNFLNTLASALATAIAIEVTGNSGVGIATGVITFFTTIFGEIIPKTVAAVKPEKTANRAAPVLIILLKIFFPFVWLFSKIAQMIKFFASRKITSRNELLTEEEFKTLIEVSENEGTIEKNERTMLYRLFEFADLHVHDIMKHRSYINAVPEKATRKEVIKIFEECGHSQLPVYKESIEMITGVVDYRTVLFNFRFDQETYYAKQCMKSVLFVPETLTALDLLVKLKQEKIGFAVALDEQGSTAGIVTMNDIMHAVFGRIIEDETYNGNAPEQLVQIINPHEFIIPGDMKLTDLNEILGLNLESEEYTTIGGWLLEKFDYLPSVGEALKHNNIVYLVEDQAKRRIVSVRIKMR